MPEQKVSVGRIVHFFGKPGDEPEAAIVTRDWGGCVNLHIFGDGSDKPARDITRICQKETDDDQNVWDWPARV